MAARFGQKIVAQVLVNEAKKVSPSGSKDHPETGEPHPDAKNRFIVGNGRSKYHDLEREQGQSAGITVVLT